MNDDAIWQRKIPILLGFIGFPFLLAAAAYFVFRRQGGFGPRSVSRSTSETQE